MTLRKKSLVVFDVCNTITKVNNTSYFISFVLQGNIFKKFLFDCLLFLSKILLSFFGKNSSLTISLRKAQIMFLRGYRKDFLDEKARAYPEYLKINGLFNKKILEIIREEQKKKSFLVLASAAIDTPIESIAKFLGANLYFSSQIKYQKGKCTGKLKKDLFGHKQKIFTDNSINLKNYQKSSVYSDNLEDLSFISHFNSINIILKDQKEQGLWKIKNKKINFILIKDKTYPVDRSNQNLIYIPSFYYFISRFGIKGAIEDFFLKQLLPYSIVLSFFSDFSFLKSFFFNLITLMLFYSFYEIGGLFNDLKAREEKRGNPTERISPDVKINFPAFLLIRLISSFLLLLLLYFGFYNNLNYYFYFCLFLLFTLVIYLIHSLLAIKLRIISFVGLKILRNFIPLFILNYLLPQSLFIFIFILFFLRDAPPRIYQYLKKQGSKISIFWPEEDMPLFICLFLLLLSLLVNKETCFIPLYFLFLTLCKNAITAC